MPGSTAPYPTRALTAKAEPVARDLPSVAQRLAGALLTVTGVGIVMGWITAEALYPSTYSIHADSLSHLGATEPPNSVVLQPSATVFDVTMLIAGALLLTAAFLTYRAFQIKRVSIPVGLLGLGAFGVGVFPLTSPTPHTLFALVAFYSGGIAVILASTIAPPVFRYIWMTLGVVALAAITAGLFFSHASPVTALGEGGIERWNTYLIVLWLIAFGSYLLSGCTVNAGRPDTT